MTTVLAPEPVHVRGEEWDIVEAAQHENAAAYAELYGRYKDTVYRFCLFRLHDRHLAEDVTSETFLRALRRIDTVTYMGRDVGAWFITIARNLILDELKSSRVKRERSCGEMLDANENSIISHQDAFGGDPMTLVVDRAVSDEVRRCIALLKKDWQTVINLRFFEGYSIAETAEAMDREVGATKALQHRALRGLAKRLPEGVR